MLTAFWKFNHNVCPLVLLSCICSNLTRNHQHNSYQNWLFNKICNQFHPNPVLTKSCTGNSCSLLPSQTRRIPHVFSMFQGNWVHWCNWGHSSDMPETQSRLPSSKKQNKKFIWDIPIVLSKIYCIVFLFSPNITHMTVDSSVCNIF